MTAKGVRCAECKFCDADTGWCRVKALSVTVRSERNCKVFAQKPEMDLNRERGLD